MGLRARRRSTITSRRTQLPAGLRFLVGTRHARAVHISPTTCCRSPVEPNHLNDQVLVRYYEREWKDIARIEHAPSSLLARAALASASPPKPSAPSPAASSTTLSRSATGSAITRRFRARATGPRSPIVIVGGGMAGLSAAWRLDKRGFHDFVLLEMEPQAGGNSRWGENEITRYPWAAHYVPVPGRKANPASASSSRSSASCATANGTSARSASLRRSASSSTAAGRKASSRNRRPPSDREQFRRFEDRMHRIPRHPASSPFRWSAAPNHPPLDQTLHGRLARRATASIRPTCAGTSTTPAATTTARSPATPPPGPASTISPRASRRKKARSPGPKATAGSPASCSRSSARYVRTGSTGLPHRARRQPNSASSPKHTEYIADAVIFAAPTFSRPTSSKAPPRRCAASNIRPGSPPISRWTACPIENGAELAWDNVIYDSPALGYVNATHMSLARHIERNRLDLLLVARRTHARAKPAACCSQKIGATGRKPSSTISSAPIPTSASASRASTSCAWATPWSGPRPGFCSPNARARWLNPRRASHFANSDLSGISIFEEAQYRGVTPPNER